MLASILRLYFFHPSTQRRAVLLLIPRLNFYQEGGGGEKFFPPVFFTGEAPSALHLSAFFPQPLQNFLALVDLMRSLFPILPRPKSGESKKLKQHIFGSSEETLRRNDDERRSILPRSSS